MAEIAWIVLDRGARPAQAWPDIATTIAGAAAERGVGLRDCVVLVPFAQLLPLMQRAFAQRGGWVPRVETTATLAASLGARPAAGPGELTFDPAVDALNAGSMLGRQAWGRAWAERDPRGVATAAAHVAHAAQAFARTAHAMRPQARAAYWGRVREALGLGDGLGARERAMARIALEWAALAEPPATDRLFSLQPAALFAVSAGGSDPLTLSLLEAAAAQIPCVIINLDDVDSACALRIPAGAPAPTLALCEDFEDEAQCAAAQVLHELQQRHSPVALIAQDRVLVRRVRALLEREAVSIRDETGWKLATTRAAGRVMSLLLAAQPGASTDALLDWLKSGTRWPETGETDEAASSLEASCRKLQIARISGLAGAEVGAQVRTLMRCAMACLDRVATGGAKQLRHWCNALGAALHDCGAMPGLMDDDAGRQVISTLGLAGNDVALSGVLGASAQVVLTQHEFTRWVDAALEAANFLPQPTPQAARAEQANVVIAPLAQTIARPFGAVVFPGADNTRLGAAGQQHPLWSDAQGVEWGLGGLEKRREDERLALAHLLSQPRVTFLRRRQDIDQRLSNSPLVEQLAATLQSQGRSLCAWVDPRVKRAVARRPVERTGPAVAAMLPQRLSASGYEALRECPYRFFAKVVLRLREQDELDRDVEKRDYGNWLHAVLHRFHAARTQAAPPAVEVQALMVLASQCQREFGLDDAEFLPFAATFMSLAPRYIEWVHQRDAQAQRWQHGEYAVQRGLGELDGIDLEGQIDRIDVIGGAVPGQSVLIDYKTGNADALKRKVSEPFEDTQLAFYAALLPESFRQSRQPLRAMYLALDSPKRIEEVEHRDVEASARALLEGMASDLDRLRSGERLLPLGEGNTCEYCEARGLCRRDHWANPLQPSP
jgi:ATP-dependent helicase/nuclease subunit B